MENSGDFEEIFVDCSVNEIEESDEDDQEVTQDPIDGLTDTECPESRREDISGKSFQCSHCPMAFPAHRKLTKHMAFHEIKKKRSNSKTGCFPSRLMGETCESSCRNKCWEKISEEERRKNYEAFKECEGAQEEWAFINSLCELVPIKSVQVRGRKRQGSVKYYLMNGQEDLIKVCAKMFLQTLSISHQRVKTAMQKRTETNATDKRGKINGFRSRFLTDEEKATKQSVIHHIGSFPRINPDFLPRNFSQPPLEGSLSVAQMHRMYEMSLVDSEVRPATLRQYRDYYNLIFNINGKSCLGEKTCTECFTYEILPPSERQVKLETYREHFFHKGTTEVLLREDTVTADAKRNVFAGILTFQPLLFAPTSTEEIFHLKQKLAVFTFTVFDLVSQEASCYMWDETLGRRGGNDVASVLIKFVRERKLRGQDEFLFWSDTTFARDEDHIVFVIYSWLSKHLGVSITHRFLERGHTSTNADYIRVAMEKVKKDRRIHIPAQWNLIIQDAFKNVYEMNLEDFLDCRLLEDALLGRKDDEGVEIRWNDVRQVTVSHNSPGILMYRYTFHDEETYKTLRVATEAREDTAAGMERKPSMRTLLLPPARRTLWPISREKYKDLMFLCAANYIPNIHHDFYKNLEVEENHLKPKNALVDTDDEEIV
ncbi:uncharacterized protein LOC129794693 [Lutzomyia longipalpis]|uniref:uncharacterized protein LOC129794693 n=1 Tax=Lutzomyia longipalpis TaxID=7200 RepID=UPI002483EFF8|nr:uncharacterized protein LOC129794693 [Lutzomyia longipalpis]